MESGLEFELELDRRIDMCKVKHPEWMDYSEEVFSTAKQDDSANRKKIQVSLQEL